MKLHELKPAREQARRKRVGRGNASGTGKTPPGHERSEGPRVGPARIRGWPDAAPTARPEVGGFTPRNRIEYAVVNVGRLDDSFEAGEP